MTTADPVATTALSGGGGGGSAPSAGTVNWAAEPGFFKFQPSPLVWYTPYLELGLVYPYKGKPITTPITIRFRVEVPRQAKGQEVTLRQAQLAAAGAATASAARVSEALSLYMYPASEGPTQFRSTMELELQPAYGGTVRGC